MTANVVPCCARYPNGHAPDCDWMRAWHEVAGAAMGLAVDDQADAYATPPGLGIRGRLALAWEVLRGRHRCEE